MEAGGIQALLMGGRADGCAVHLQELHRELRVYLGDGLRVAAIDSAAEASSERQGSRYQLVEPVGPEMPVYVRA
jgi:hypothetical protein